MSEILYFIKFSEEKYANKLIQNGEIFFNKTKKFANDPNPERGDKYEGTEWIDKSKISYIKFTSPAFGERILNISSESNSEIVQYNHNYLLYSLFAVTQEYLESIDSFKIDERMIDFGDTAVIIQNPKSFLNSILYELKKQNISYKYNIVKYDDFNDKKTNMNPFKKKIEHIHQSEFRIIIEKKDDNPKLISIGSIENYCRKMSTTDLIESEWKIEYK
ncbi:Uncharacterised protein [Algoriella xinjiangensis]|uniref:hypothetical protein n=1 Tax=Algoriella xinjiangensis TaxID=684065 RepID=UPI000F635708|nr:hypothetical protein [Algoriella xinjiangensis]VDH16856.1 Uncharacterised protein [Algoriella xinjiangensis]